MLDLQGSPWVQLPALSAVAARMLRANTRCLYLNVAGSRLYLAAAGVNVEQEVRGRALVLSSDMGHLTNCQFDVDRMIRFLADALGLVRVTARF